MQLAQQVWTSSSTAKAIAVRTLAASLTTITLRHPPAERQLTVAAQEIAKALPKAFRNTVSNFSSRPVHFQKHMIIVSKEPLPSAIHKCHTKTQKSFTTRTSKVLRKLRVIFQGSNFPEKINTLDAVTTLQYERSKNSTTRMAKRTTVCNEDNKLLTQR